MTPHLKLPFLAAAQSSKHVTHNDALLLLDALCQLAVLSEVSVPPDGAQDGDRHLIAAAAGGGFAGQDGRIALRQDGAWRFLEPVEGWLVWNAQRQVWLTRRSGAWRTTDQFERLGVNIDPGARRFAVSGDDALFTHAGADHRLIVNKAARECVASLVLQDAWSGRAEIGLCGDDALHVKTSPDGTAWTDALVVDANSGKVSLPQTVNAPGGLAGLDGAGQLARAAFPAMIGDAGAGGARGAVPAPAIGDAAAGKVLGAGGEWVGRMPGFRNRLRNPSFQINQRGVAGAVTLAAGAYGHDGVKAGANGATYAFSTSGLDVTLSISAGTLILPVEAGLIEGGACTLSHEGTAQARVWQGTGTNGAGAYVSAARSAGGLTVTGLTAATQTNIEFSAGTIIRPQFEPGGAMTAFERRPPSIEWMLCLRYYYVWKGSGYDYFYPFAPAANYRALNVIFPTPMAASPTCSLQASAGMGSFLSGFPGVFKSTPFLAALRGDVSAAAAYSWIDKFTASAEI